MSGITSMLALIGTMTAGQAAALRLSQSGPAAPTYLRCEYLVDPLGIDEPRPRLSWEMVDTRRGAAQTAYRVIAAGRLEDLAAERGTLWDSGKVRSDQSIQIEYGGSPLPSRARAWWQVRIWDADGEPSPWSQPAQWSMGLLKPADWRANWIGDPTPVDLFQPARNGFHSQLSDDPETLKWLAVDLGRKTPVDGVRLLPARPYNWREDDPGFLFPVRFRIELATEPDFSDATVAVDRSSADVSDPGDEPLSCSFEQTAGRYVRLLVTRCAAREPGSHGFALAEFEVLNGRDNVARGALVSASDSIEGNGWSVRNAVDGNQMSHGPSGTDPLTPPMLRRAFVVAGGSPPARATLYATALGLYELRLNGTRVGRRVLAPEWTDYHRRVQYQTYDVTDLIRAGDNALGVVLADGWYAGRIGLTGIVPGGPPRGVYGRTPRFLMQLEIEYADGRIDTISTDDKWRSTTDGPLRTADLLDGEEYDARRQIPGWDQPGFDDRGWTQAKTLPSLGIDFVAQANEPIRATEELKAVALTEPQSGAFVFDMGQNMVGWCRLKARGEPGRTIMLRHAEVLNPDGTIYTDNLRSAAQTDRFTPAGTGLEVYEPRFTYHGFRYVEVTGLAGRPTLDTLTGMVVRSAPPETGEFECSDPMLNKLWQNIRWTQRANMHSIPTDCPQRDERLGWMGDILAFAQTACLNMDMAAFFTKWTRDVRDAQTDDGRYPDFAPHPFEPDKRFSGVPAWGDAGVFVPWCAYRNYGDERLLRRHFESARRWVDWIHANNPGLLWENSRGNDYGDWLNADTLQLEGWPQSGAQVPKDVFGTVFFAQSARLVSEMARVVGRDDEAREYAALTERIREAFITAYVGEDGRIKGDTQAGYALALHYGLLPENLRPAALGHMIRCFDRYDGQISTGFLSTVCLMKELTRAGRTEEAYRLILNRRMPSWGYAIDHGATTMWERWDGYVEGRGFQNPGMNSFAHYAFGSVGQWMYETIIGINPDPEVPAFNRFILRPEPGGGLTWAGGAHQSIYGRIESGWILDGDVLTVRIRVPPNTTARLHLPTTDPATVTEDGKPIAESEGVSIVGSTDRSLVCDLTSGSFQFTGTWRPGP